MNSEYRVDKLKLEAIVTLSNGTTSAGSFFVAGSSATHEGPERVVDLLNEEPGFFPFEVSGPRGTRTALYNRSHVVMVALGEPDEPSRAPGYDIARRRQVSVVLSNGVRVRGSVRIYRPSGHDRLSDYTRESEVFRYLETDEGTLLVNSQHIVEMVETTDNDS